MVAAENTDQREQLNRCEMASLGGHRILLEEQAIQMDSALASLSSLNLQVWLLPSILVYTLALGDVPSIHSAPKCCEYYVSCLFTTHKRETPVLYATLSAQETAE